MNAPLGNVLSKYGYICQNLCILYPAKVKTCFVITEYIFSNVNLWDLFCPKVTWIYLTCILFVTSIHQTTNLVFPNFFHETFSVFLWCSWQKFSYQETKFKRTCLHSLFALCNTFIHEFLLIKKSRPNQIAVLWCHW